MDTNLDADPDVEAHYVALEHVAQTAARSARAVLLTPTLSDPALFAECAMRVCILGKAGRVQEAGLIADAVPRVPRVWRGGACHPDELLRLYRTWSEETVLLRTAEVQRRELPEHDSHSRGRHEREAVGRGRAEAQGEGSGGCGLRGHPAYACSCTTYIALARRATGASSCRRTASSAARRGSRRSAFVSRHGWPFPWNSCATSMFDRCRRTSSKFLRHVRLLGGR